MINIDNITRHHFDRAIEMIEGMRDRALGYEEEARAADSLCSFTDGLAIELDTNFSIAPEERDAIIALLQKIDPSY